MGSERAIFMDMIINTKNESVLLGHTRQSNMQIVGRLLLMPKQQTEKEQHRPWLQQTVILRAKKETTFLYALWRLREESERADLKKKFHHALSCTQIN